MCSNILCIRWSENQIWWKTFSQPWNFHGLNFWEAVQNQRYTYVCMKKMWTMLSTTNWTKTRLCVSRKLFFQFSVAQHLRLSLSDGEQQRKQLSFYKNHRVFVPKVCVLRLWILTLFYRHESPEFYYTV